MSWLNMLYTTYQNRSQSELYEDLLPIAHTTQQAQIEVTINENSDFVASKVVAKDDAETLIPCTEQSAGRSGSHPVNHPLMDKLQYVAGDYTEFGGEKGESFHTEYMTDLLKWCESEYANPKVKALYNYLKKGTLISDLVKDKVLYCDENNKLIKNHPNKAKAPEIFRVVQGTQSDAFVRFRVTGIDNITALWQDKKLQTDYINYYLSNRDGNELCYVLGKRMSCSLNHPNKIRNTGDKAKLISANDTSGFTYRGRFTDAEEAVGVSYEVSQGAHNALKWLIGHQGRNYGGRVYVVWNPRGYEVPDINKDSYEALLGINQKLPYTAKEFADQFHRAMSGYKGKLQYYDQIIILGIDAATTGRMAITFYREMLGNELIDNIEHWHVTCAWRHRYKFKEDKSVQEFYGAPSPNDIALVAFGTERTNYLEMDDKLRANVVERILHCIIDRTPLPYDIVNAAYGNMCHPQNYSNRNTWQKVLSISCSLIKKYYYDHSKTQEKEEWNVEINQKEESMPYLCGRLLAVADALEKGALGGENRTTTAMRYFTKFVEHPCQTWDVINRSLPPYIAKLGGNAVYYLKQLGEISAKIPENDFLKAKNLDGRMALGFYSQQNFIYTKKEDKEKNKDENKED